MANYSVATLKNDLISVLHGTTTNQIVNLNGLIYRAARQVLMDVDPQETKRIVPITGPVFNEVNNYACPTDLKGNKLIDIRPQVNRQPGDVWLQDYNQDFDLSKNVSPQDQFTIQFNTSVKTIQISSPSLPPGVVLNQASSIQGNGTWAVGGDATDLTVDNQNFVSGSGSLQFNLSGATGIGYLECTGMTPIDISNQLNQAEEFWYTYMPTGSQFSFNDLRWGSDSSNYYHQSTITTQEGTVFQDGWNLLKINWLGAHVVGSPDPSNITYLRVTWDYSINQPQTAVRLNSIVSRMGLILNVEYYSKFLFRDFTTNAFQETITSDTNLINLDTETYNLLFNKVAYLAAQQQQGLDANFHDGPFFEKAYAECLQRYKAMYKSEFQKPVQVYYAQPRGNYDRFLGRSWLGGGW